MQKSTAKKRAKYECQNCGAQSHSDDPFCHRCGVEYPWETEENDAPTRSKTKPVCLATVEPLEPPRVDVGALNAAFGDGFPLSASMIVSGMPGSGKSTIALIIAERFEKVELRTLYVSDEMPLGLLSAMQRRVAPRLKKMVAWHKPELSDVIDEILSENYGLVIVDSLQRSSEAASAALLALLGATQARSCSLIAICHATKEGDIAGEMGDQHDVDVTAWISRDEQGATLRVSKSRFGPAPIEARFA